MQRIQKTLPALIFQICLTLIRQPIYSYIILLICSSGVNSIYGNGEVNRIYLLIIKSGEWKKLKDETLEPILKTDPDLYNEYLVKKAEMFNAPQLLYMYLTKYNRKHAYDQN